MSDRIANIEITLYRPIAFLNEYNRRLAEGMAAKKALAEKYGGSEDEPFTFYDRIAEEERRAFWDLPEKRWSGGSPGVWQVRTDRDVLMAEFSFAIPCEEALECIARHAADRGVVEIGAGSGYWAMLLAERGVDVVAFDREPYKPYGGLANIRDEMPHWFPVERANEQIAGKYPDRVLMLCWPPYSTPMAADALAAYERAGGDTLVYIGEGSGGCTGDDRFHERLCAEHWDDEKPCGNPDHEWQEVEAVEIPQFWGLHDELFVYRLTRKEEEQ